MPKQVKKVAQKDFDDLSDYAQGDYELDSEEEKAREKRIQKRIDLARQRKEKFDQEYPPLTPEKQKELDELDPWKNSKELFNGRRVAQKSEQDVAKSMKEKGYNYIVQIQDSDAEPLYTKTMQQTSELLRTDLKNNRTNVMKIDEFLSKKGSSKRAVGGMFKLEYPGIRKSDETIDFADVEPTGQAELTSRVLPAPWNKDEEWQEPAKLPDGRKCWVIYQFDPDEVANGLPEDYPWDEDHVTKIVLDTGDYAVASEQEPAKLEGALKKLGDESTKKQAAKMPGLFNSDYKKWLQMEAKILAMNAGAPSSQEEAELLMDKSIDKLVDMVADSVENEIYDVVDEVREDIIEEMIKKMQAQEVPVEALPEIEEPEAEISEPAVQAKPIAIPGSSLNKAIERCSGTWAYPKTRSQFHGLLRVINQLKELGQNKLGDPEDLKNDLNQITGDDEVFDELESESATGNSVLNVIKEFMLRTIDNTYLPLSREEKVAYQRMIDRI